ncbi:MAG: class I SAM-dependent methyltransferase [Vallitaleaceae bacterium]|nr:class I SAM-dependent methyltransferase [Vallitaleaceae bacterium]
MLTKRLESIASYVGQGAIVADVGTDHGYIPIELARRGIVKKAYALDINKGPLEKAEANITAYGLNHIVKTAISDGLLSLEDESVDTVIIAGMGGNLISKILREGTAQLKHIKRLILSPHLDVNLVRKTVHQLGFCIIEENMIIDENQYYNILICEKGLEVYNSQTQYQYGKLLIDMKHPVLISYLVRKLDTIKTILDKMESADLVETCTIIERIEELKKEQKIIQEVLDLLC